MVRVGGEVDAFCTRCMLTLAHTVHAVVSGRAVKVECNTCHAVHRHRGSSAGSPRPPRERPATVGFDALLAARNGAPRPYSVKATFAVDDVVDHPVFGRGVVTALRDAGKVEITFRSDVRILVHGRS